METECVLAVRETRCVEVDSGQPVPPPSAVEELLRFIESRIRCPLTIADTNGAKLNVELTLSWWEFLREGWQVDAEVPYGTWNLNHVQDLVARTHYEGPVGDLRDAYPDAINIAGWYPAAREEFLGKVGLLRAPVAGPKARSKHWPSAAARSSADLARQSMEGVSVLAFGVTPDAIGAVAREVEADLVDHLLRVESFRAFVDCVVDVGFSQGVATNWLAVEWSTTAVHAYPVLKREFAPEPVELPLRWEDTFGAPGTTTFLTASTSYLVGKVRDTRA